MVRGKLLCLDFFVSRRMVGLLKRFRLDFNDVIVMTDSERRPHAKKYVYRAFLQIFKNKSALGDH